MRVEQVLTDARQRFVAGFAAQCDSIGILVGQTAGAWRRGPAGALLHVVHRLSGLAGTLGFPTVSARAADLESLVGAADFDPALARDAVQAVREAFHLDAGNPPDWATRPTAPARILVVEDEPDQLTIVTASLEAAGYVVVPVTSGELVLAAARAEKPALILLDVVMPRLDGYSACRLLKADPELAGIPIILITAGANLDDRLAGLTLGADEFLIKPVDMRELTLRIQIALDRCRARHAPAGGAGVSRELSYDAFLAVVRDAIARGPVAVAMVRLPADRHGEAAILLTEDLRGRDSLGAYGPGRVLVLMPEMTAASARDRLEAVVDRLDAHGVTGVCVGVTAAVNGTGSAEAVIGEADEALAHARYLGHKIATWSEPASRSPAAPAIRTVVVAEDDPDVTRIVDAQMRAGGYQVFLAFDGEQALAAVRAHAPDVLVLDLMMPTVDGFEVLRQLQAAGPSRPRVIVLSGRGREEDVMRAFGLGADDYMTKPFNPQELMARVARVLK